MILTTRTSRKHRPCLGIVLLAIAAFVVFAPQCGLLGHTVAHALRYLVGSTGTGLLMAVLVLSGLTCLTPNGTVARLWSAYRKRQRTRPTRSITVVPPAPVRLSRSEELRQAALAEGYDPAHVESMLPRLVQMSEGIESQIRKSAKAPAVHDDTRGALKGLGYVYAEIDRVLPRLDRSQDTAGQIRQALKLLQRAS